MLRAMDSAVAGLRAHQSKLDVIGHNIANVNTFGFKTQNYSFKEAMYQTSSASTNGTDTAGGTNAAQYGYGTLTGSISVDMTSSTPTYVGGFNASIDGEGFFITYASKIETGTLLTQANLKETDLAYTRVGQFNIDSNGYMTDSSGNFVYGYRTDSTKLTNPEDTDYGTDLLPLRIPGFPTNNVNAGNYGADAVKLTDVKINSLGLVSGTIQSDNEDINGKVIVFGKVAIASFQNPEGMTKKGGFYYGATENDNSGQVIVGAPGEKSLASLLTGYIEASNVDMAKEFADMITTQRGFQANTKIITVSDEILADVVNMKR